MKLTEQQQQDVQAINDIFRKAVKRSRLPDDWQDAFYTESVAIVRSTLPFYLKPFAGLFTAILYELLVAFHRMNFGSAWDNIVRKNP